MRWTCTVMRRGVFPVLGAGISAVAAATVPTVSQPTPDDAKPVIAWTVEAEIGITASRVQVSYFADREFSDLPTVFEGSGSFACTNTAADVGVPLHYRLRFDRADATDYSDAVCYRCVRQLERAVSDQTKLRTGVTLLPFYNYATQIADDDIWIGYPVGKVFDGNLGSYADIFRHSGGRTETLVGVRLPEPAHVTGAWIYPRNQGAEGVMARCGMARLVASASDADFAATNVVMLADRQDYDGIHWYYRTSTDTANTYSHVFFYDGPLAGGQREFYANAGEARFWGWTASDEIAGGLILGAPQRSWVSITDPTPVLSWTVIGSIITNSCLQYAYSAEGPYFDLGEVRNGTGTFAVTNAAAEVGSPLYYRVRYASAVVAGDSYGAALRVTRPRQLERTASDQYHRAAGVTVLPPSNYATTTTLSASCLPPSNAFDGNTGNYVDIFSTAGLCESVVGVRLPERAYVSDVCLYPRSGQIGRTSKARILGCATDADYAATNTVLLMEPQTFSEAAWYHVALADPSVACQYVFAYDGPLHGGLKGFYGNVSELRFFGWTAADEAATRHLPEAPAVAPDSPTNTVPIATWSVEHEMIASTQLEFSYRPEGPFRPAGTVRDGIGSFAYTNAIEAVGLTAYYRVKYVSLREGVGYTAVTAYTRSRQLERAESDQTQLRAGVTVLPTQYADKIDNLKELPGPAAAFDGKLNSWPDITDSSWHACETVVGVRLAEPAYIGDIWFYPRTGQVGRAGQSYALACADDAAYAATNTVALAGKQKTTELRWYRQASGVTTNAFQYVFEYTGILTGGAEAYVGNHAEIRFFGWTDADTAAVTVCAPEGVRARPHGRRGVRLSWSSAVRAESIRIERCVAGTAAWTTVAEGVAPSAGTYDDTGLAYATYEYRVISVGLSGYMETVAEVVASECGRSGLTVIVR